MSSGRHPDVDVPPRGPQNAGCEQHPHPGDPRNGRGSPAKSVRSAGFATSRPPPGDRSPPRCAGEWPWQQPDHPRHAGAAGRCASATVRATRFPAAWALPPTLIPWTDTTPEPETAIVTSWTIRVTHEQRVAVLRELIARPGAAQIGPPRRAVPTPTGTTTAMPVSHEQRVAALSRLMAVPGSARIGAPRPR